MFRVSPGSGYRHLPGLSSACINSASMVAHPSGSATGQPAERDCEVFKIGDGGAGSASVQICAQPPKQRFCSAIRGYLLPKQ